MYSDTHNHLRLDPGHERKCIKCGTLTRWVELSFEAPLCPGDCTNEMWHDFDQAQQKGNE